MIRRGFTLKTLKELEQIREQTLKNLQLRKQEDSKLRVVVGMGTCGISAGARSVLNTLIQEVNNCHLEEVMITQTGCVGMCAYEPIFEVYDESEKTTYVHMTPEKTRRVVLEHLVNGNVVSEFTIDASLN